MSEYEEAKRILKEKFGSLIAENEDLRERIAVLEKAVSLLKRSKPLLHHVCMGATEMDECLSCSCRAEINTVLAELEAEDG